MVCPGKRAGVGVSVGQLLPIEPEFLKIPSDSPLPKGRTTAFLFFKGDREYFPLFLKGDRGGFAMRLSIASRLTGEMHE
jgi:hypothetical protein